MKKYTLKYLPVEGEIGMGDHYLLFSHGLKSGKRRLEETGQQFVIVPRWTLHHFTGKQGDKLALLTNPSDRKKVKLYLVSHELSVDDLVWCDHERRVLVIPDGEVREYDRVNQVVLHPNGDAAVDETDLSVRVSGWANLSALTRYNFRVIGEISPIPPGIKLDQEVTEDDVKFLLAVVPGQADSWMEFNERTYLEHPEYPRKIEIKTGV